MARLLSKLRWRRFSRALSELEKAQRNLAKATIEVTQAQQEYNNKLRKASDEPDG